MSDQKTPARRDDNVDRVVAGAISPVRQCGYAPTERLPSERDWDGRSRRSRVTPSNS